MATVTAVIGVDLGGTNVKAVVASREGEIQLRTTQPSCVSEGPKTTIERVLSLVTRIRETHPVLAIGLGICGPVNSAGELVESPILPGWPSVPVAAELAARIDIPVVVDNDANCAMLGEWWLGAGERRDTVAGLTLGTGIGGGLILGGAVFRGSGRWAGEFGHIALERDPACPCGGRGCLNVLGSVTATIARYRAAGGGAVDGTEELVARGLRGDALANEALKVSVDYIGRGIRVLLNALNPDVIVLAGGMAAWGAPLVDRIAEGLRGTTFEGLDRTPIHTGHLGIYSGAVGAALLAHEEVAKYN